MNSVSPTNSNYDRCDKIHSSNQFSLTCGEPGQAVLPFSAVGTTATVAAVTVDTSKFCNPCTKLEFSSNLIGTAFTGTVNFQVFRICDNQPPTPIGGVFTFTAIGLPVVARSFSFFVCDCNLCPQRCCAYTVVVTVVGADIVGNIGVFAARLAAITSDNPTQDC